MATRLTVGMIASLLVLGSACGGGGNDFTYTVPSTSMEPTLEMGDVVSGKTKFGEIQRDDVIVFTAPPGAATAQVSDLIKRVVGLPGETIEGRARTIYIRKVDASDLEPLPEPYLGPGVRSREFPPEKIPPRRYFVLGDNRQDSRDSTFFHAIDEESVKAVITRIDKPKERRGKIE